MQAVKIDSSAAGSLPRGFNRLGRPVAVLAPPALSTDIHALKIESSPRRDGGFNRTERDPLALLLPERKNDCGSSSDDLPQNNSDQRANHVSHNMVGVMVYPRRLLALALLTLVLDPRDPASPCLPQRACICSTAATRAPGTPAPAPAPAPGRQPIHAATSA